MWVHQNTWGRVSQAKKLGYGIHVTVHAWREMGWGCQQMHRQVGVTPLCMCKGFSHLKEEADNPDII